MRKVTYFFRWHSTKYPKYFWDKAKEPKLWRTLYWFFFGLMVVTRTKFSVYAMLAVLFVVEFYVLWDGQEWREDWNKKKVLELEQQISYELKK